MSVETSMSNHVAEIILDCPPVNALTSTEWLDLATNIDNLAHNNDVRVILFIVMNAKFFLTEDLLKKIKTQIRKNASPRHVPSKVIVVSDIPRTKSGKIVELAVKNTIEGNNIKNKEALANPKVLEQFKNLKELSV